MSALWEQAAPQQGSVLAAGASTQQLDEFQQRVQLDAVVFTCRLVNEQEPSKIAEQIESYLHHPLVQALDRSIEKTWGRRPEYKRMDGSVPIAPVFQNQLDVPTLLLGFNVENGGFHGPHEFIHIQLFHKGLETMVHLLRDLGTA